MSTLGDVVRKLMELKRITEGSMGTKSSATAKTMFLQWLRALKKKIQQTICCMFFWKK